MQQEQEGSLDKLSHMFRLPDIKRLGIELDVPKGVVVKRSEGAAHAAELQAGDRITALNNTPVWTFGDLQYHYDHVPRQAIRLGVTYVDPAAKLLKRHDLLVGDIIYAVDDVEQDPLADLCLLYIRLRKTAGDTVMLALLRDGRSLRLPLKAESQSFGMVQIQAI